MMDSCTFKNVWNRLKEVKEKDNLYKIWCKENNFKLIRIKHDLYIKEKIYWIKILIKEAYFENAQYKEYY